MEQFSKRNSVILDCEYSLILAMAIVGRAKYTRLRAKFRGDATRGQRQNIFSALPSRRVFSKFRAHAFVYFARPSIAIAKIRDYSQSTVIYVSVAKMDNKKLRLYSKLKS